MGNGDQCISVARVRVAAVACRHAVPHARASAETKPIRPHFLRRNGGRQVTVTFFRAFTGGYDIGRLTRNMKQNLFCSVWGMSPFNSGWRKSSSSSPANQGCREIVCHLRSEFLDQQPRGETVPAHTGIPVIFTKAP